MLQAYSRLMHVLNQRKMTLPELRQRLEQRGVRVSAKSLHRLGNEHRSLRRLDLRVAGAICQVCEAPLSELIAFAPDSREMASFQPAEQERLDVLMAKNNDGHLTAAEHEELATLVGEAEQMTLHNARVLARQRRQQAARAT